MSEPTGAGVLPAGDLPPAPSDADTLIISDAMMNDFADRLLSGIPPELVKIADAAIMMARPFIAIRFHIDVKGGLMDILKAQITGIMEQRGGKAIALFKNEAHYLETVQVVAYGNDTDTGTVFKIAHSPISTTHQLLDGSTLGDLRDDGDGQNEVHETSDQPLRTADANTSLLTRQ